MNGPSRGQLPPHMVAGLNVVYWQIYTEFWRAEFLALLVQLDDLLDSAIDPHGRGWLTTMKPAMRHLAEDAIVYLGASRRTYSESPLLSLADVGKMNRHVTGYVSLGAGLPENGQPVIDAVIETVIATLLAPLLACSNDTDAAFSAYMRHISREWGNELGHHELRFTHLFERTEQRARVLGQVLETPERWLRCMALVALAFGGPGATARLGDDAGYLLPKDDPLAWEAISEVLVPEVMPAQVVEAVMAWFYARGPQIFPGF